MNQACAKRKGKHSSRRQSRVPTPLLPMSLLITQNLLLLPFRSLLTAISRLWIWMVVIAALIYLWYQYGWEPSEPPSERLRICLWISHIIRGTAQAKPTWTPTLLPPYILVSLAVEYSSIVVLLLLVYFSGQFMFWNSSFWHVDPSNSTPEQF